MNNILLSASFGLLSLACAGQTILPQIADGGNWRTAITLVNTTTSAVNANLNFYQDTSNGATQPWNPPFLEVNNTQNLSIPPAGTLYIHTPGTASQLTQGWAQLTGSAGVQAYAIYTYEGFSGRPDQDGTSQAVAASTRILVPFDNTPGYSTGVAVVNPTGTSELVSVNIQTDNGTAINTTLQTIPANGQMAFVASQQLPVTSGHRGLMEFFPSTGTIAIAAFRFNPTLALTSTPVLPQIGAPIIGNTAAPTSFGTITGVGSFSAGSAPPVFSISIIPNSDGTYQATYSAGIATGTLEGISSDGQTFTFNTLRQSTAVVSAGIAISLSPSGQNTGSATGTFAGTLTEQFTQIFGGGITTGAISGNYTKIFVQ